MFVHRIDPVLGEVGGLYLWWYGLSYTLGFLELHLWFRWRRDKLGFTMREVWDVSVILPAFVLLGGRAVEVFAYEWPYYREHPTHILMFWIGGMSTHGLLLGAAVGTALFCMIHRKSFVRMADELVIPGAVLMGVGRIGNFIDGQIVGGLTTMPWGVQFPDADGFRHPVVLYDGLKNLLLVPVLLALRSRRPPRGVLFTTFFLLYAFLRIFVDVFREYPTTLLGLATGQSLNIGMTVVAGILLLWFSRQPRMPLHETRAHESSELHLGRMAAFALLLLFCMTMPSDWTQDVPARYGKRHPGLEYSALYPRVAAE